LVNTEILIGKFKNQLGKIGGCVGCG